MDYLEPELWREYIKYAIQGCRLSPKLDFEDEEDEGDDEKDHGDQDDDGDDLPAAWSTLDEVRAIYSSALHATALHFTQSHVVWNLVIKFEIHQITSANSTYSRLLTALMHITNTSLLYSSSAPTDKVSKVRKMFLERLATPHKGTKGVFVKVE